MLASMIFTIARFANMHEQSNGKRVWLSDPTTPDQEQLMSKFILPETALSRVVEDEDAPVTDRVRALRMLSHPPLVMLRRLLHRSRANPERVPSRLLAAASISYAKEVAFRKSRQAYAPKHTSTGNALGI
jgi:hypothetical protein